MTRRRALAALGLALIVLATPVAVRAESALWTLVASPLAATTGVQTTFTLTATNTDPTALLLTDSEIGCILVDVPTSFTIQGATVTGSNAGSGWHVDAITGNRVKVHTDSGGERLETFDWVRFTITATALSTGSLAWSSRAFRDQNCGGSGALLGVPPIVVVTGPTVTPTPLPTPTPTPTLNPTPRPTPTSTPRPTTAPTPTPTPTLQLPVPLPSLPLPSLGVPSVGATASPTPTPRSGEPSPDNSAPAPSAAPDAGASPGLEGGGGPPPATPPSAGGAPEVAPGVAAPTGARDAPQVDFDPATLDIDFDSVGLGGATVWLVPTATFTIPAILLLLFVALQAIGALAWVPAVRRLGGRDDEVA